MTVTRGVMIWDADYPWDIRVDKITRALHKEGFRIGVVCRNLKRLPEKEIIGGVTFHRLPPFRSSKLNTLLSFPFFFNIFWLEKIYSVAREEKAEFLIVRDLPLAISAIMIGKVLKIPVVIDMAENYPAMIMDTRRFGKPEWWNVLIRNVSLAKRVESFAIKRIQKFIVVTEENKQRLVRNGVREADIYVVSNTPDLDEYRKAGSQIPESEEAFFKSRFTLIYVGGLGPIRGLEMVVQAMPEIVKEIPQAHLLLVGKGEKKNILQRLAEERKVSSHVTLKGWVDFSCVPQYIKCSSVGIIPHRSTEHTNTTIPNKIFDYMAFELPVIASDTAPMKRVIQEAKCGVVFEADNPCSFVEAVRQVYRDRENHFGRSGKKAVEAKYNWGKDTEVLLSVFHRLQAPCQ